jgi:hypothetical protein
MINVCHDVNTSAFDYMAKYQINGLPRILLRTMLAMTLIMRHCESGWPKPSRRGNPELQNTKLSQKNFMR